MEPSATACLGTTRPKRAHCGINHPPLSHMAASAVLLYRFNAFEESAWREREREGEKTKR
eukprot:3933834-Pyramimonas_sp.AAC.1